MMHNQSHQPIWMYCPLAAKPRTRWQRILDWLEDFFRPIALPEGRRRIDPNEPYGAWSNGFYEPTLPKEKAR